MAQYLVTYTNGCDQHITADKVHLNSAEGHYVFTTSTGERVAFTPLSGVLSIVRIETTKDCGYPRQDGDVTVLGPEIFASADGETICWKGENYTRQSTSKTVTG